MIILSFESDYRDITLEDYFALREEVETYFSSSNRKDVFRSLNQEQKEEVMKCADFVYNNACLIAPFITDDIKLLVSDLEGILVPLDNTIKGKTSLYRKIIADSVDYKGNYQIAAKRLRDSVRYTIIIEDSIYIKKVDEYLHKLEDMGYQNIVVNNNWGTLKCQGINTKITTKDGNNVFELQFHTPMGYKIKEDSTRDLYKVFRDEDVDPELKDRVNKVRKLLQSTIKVPEGALEYRYDSDSNIKRR